VAGADGFVFDLAGGGYLYPFSDPFVRFLFRHSFFPESNIDQQ
jgi:hypothetical protein